MTIIKAANAGKVRSFSTALDHAVAEPVVAVPPARSGAELALEEARDEIARLQARLLSMDEVRHDEREAAYAAGRKDGIDSAGDDAERRLAAFRDATEAALTSWRDRLAGLDTLAALLARGALAKIFSPSADLADLVSRAIAARMDQLQAGSVVAVRVSAADFDGAALAAVATPPGVEIVPDRDLASRDCRIDLRLGQIDLSMSGLARQLDSFFESLAAAEP